MLMILIFLLCEMVGLVVGVQAGIRAEKRLNFRNGVECGVEQISRGKATSIRSLGSRFETLGETVDAPGETFVISVPTVSEAFKTFNSSVIIRF